MSLSLYALWAVFMLRCLYVLRMVCCYAPSWQAVGQDLKTATEGSKTARSARQAAGLCAVMPFHSQFFLKNHAKIYAEPKIAIMVTNPATERTAIPDRAAPLVHLSLIHI